MQNRNKHSDNHDCTVHASKIKVLLSVNWTSYEGPPRISLSLYLLFKLYIIIIIFFNLISISLLYVLLILYIIMIILCTPSSKEGNIPKKGYYVQLIWNITCSEYIDIYIYIYQNREEEITRGFDHSAIGHFAYHLAEPKLESWKSSW